MKIDKLSNLISSFGQKTAANPVDETETQGVNTQQASAQSAQAAQSEEAAKLSSGFGVSESDSAQQTEKVRRLKEQVSSGTYNPDSTEVAKSFLKEIISL